MEVLNEKIIGVPNEKRFIAAQYGTKWRYDQLTWMGVVNG
jgi:hypothetical protein